MSPAKPSMACSLWSHRKRLVFGRTQSPGPANCCKKYLARYLNKLELENVESTFEKFGKGATLVPSFNSSASIFLPLVLVVPPMDFKPGLPCAVDWLRLGNRES